MWAIQTCKTEGGATATERVQVEESKLDSGDVRVELEVCGLCGTDLFKLAQPETAAGLVLGHELVGRIVEVDSEARFFDGRSPRLGQRIVVPHHVACQQCDLCRRGNPTLCATFRENLFVPGGFAERVRIRARAVAAAMRVIPDSIADEAAVFLEPAACVLRGIERAALPEDQPRVLVVGAGSMGLLHLLVLRVVHPGATVVLSDPMAERRSLAEQLGADAAVVPELLGQEDRYRNFDVVFDTVGGAAILSGSLEVTRAGGRVVLFAHARALERADFDLNQLFKEERSVLATYSGSLAEQETIWRFIESGALDASPLVSHRLSLAQFDRATDLCRNRQALKILLTRE